MPLLDCRTPGDAEGPTKQVYDNFLNQIGIIPAPLVLLTASPGLLGLQLAGFSYNRNHKALSAGLMTCVRYLVAVDQGFSACVEFNEHLLGRMGAGPDELAALRADPRQAPLEQRERDLLAFVIGAVLRPAEVDPAALEALHQQGWTDADVLDACFHGTDLMGKARLVQAFGAESIRATPGPS